MSTLDLESGRSRQKRRTREALLDAARDLVTERAALTVEAAAERAGISRTTAYRYFPNRTALLAAAHPETTTGSLLPPDPPDDVRERLDLAVDAFTALIRDTEPQQRAMLRFSLEPRTEGAEALPLRQGRAIRWFTEALEPLRAQLDEAQIERLVLAIRSACGIEALVWLTDVAGLSGAQARALMQWSARALLDGALADAPPTSSSTTPAGRELRSSAGTRGSGRRGSGRASAR
jgi:AcrR family transcriptional regulator